MIGNRRDFLKASAAAGVIGAGTSEVLADTPDPWIGVLHSTGLEGLLEDAFLLGLRNQNWEGDPTQKPGPGRKKVVIRKINCHGKYGGTYGTALANAATDLNDVTPGTKLKLFVALGGIVTAKAFASINSHPILVVLGRNDVYPIPAGQKVGGFDMKAGLHSDRLAKLQTFYGVPANRTCLFYNGNSAMAGKEVTDWERFGGLTFNATNGNNEKLEAQGAIAGAIDGAVAKFSDTNTPFAIVVSSDPFFTSKRGDIIGAVIDKQKGLDKLVVCYPVSDYYLDALSRGADANKTMGYGPKLVDVYQSIGDLAGQYLTDNSKVLTITDAVYQFNGA